MQELFQFEQCELMPGTIRIHKSALNNFINNFGDLHLNNVSLKQIDQFKAIRLQTVSPVTVNIELRSLKSIFNTALRWNLITTNPFSKTRFCLIPETAPIFLTKQDFQILLSVIKVEWLKEVIIFAVLTGMRRDEILNLKWQNINLDSASILIQSSANFKTKQGKRRTIPINNIALQMLNRLQQKKSASEFIFNLNGKQIKNSWLSHSFKKAVRVAQLNDAIHFHSLRHTFASWLVQGGTPIYEVQKLLGHSNIKVTEIYSHLQPDNLLKTVNKLQISVN